MDVSALDELSVVRKAIEAVGETKTSPKSRKDAEEFMFKLQQRQAFGDACDMGWKLLTRLHATEQEKFFGFRLLQNAIFIQRRTTGPNTPEPPLRQSECEVFNTFAYNLLSLGDSYCRDAQRSVELSDPLSSQALQRWCGLLLALAVITNSKICLSEFLPLLVKTSYSEGNSDASQISQQQALVFLSFILTVACEASNQGNIKGLDLTFPERAILATSLRENSSFIFLTMRSILEKWNTANVFFEISVDIFCTLTPVTDVEFLLENGVHRFFVSALTNGCVSQKEVLNALSVLAGEIGRKRGKKEAPCVTLPVSSFDDFTKILVFLASSCTPSEQPDIEECTTHHSVVEMLREYLENSGDFIVSRLPSETLESLWRSICQLLLHPSTIIANDAIKVCLSFFKKFFGWISESTHKRETVATNSRKQFPSSEASEQASIIPEWLNMTEFFVIMFLRSVRIGELALQPAINVLKSKEDESLPSIRGKWTAFESLMRSFLRRVSPQLVMSECSSWSSWIATYAELDEELASQNSFKPVQGNLRKATHQLLQGFSVATQQNHLCQSLITEKILWALRELTQSLLHDSCYAFAAYGGEDPIKLIKEQTTFLESIPEAKQPFLCSSYVIYDALCCIFEGISKCALPSYDPKTEAPPPWLSIGSEIFNWLYEMKFLNAIDLSYTDSVSSGKSPNIFSTSHSHFLEQRKFLFICGSAEFVNLACLMNSALSPSLEHILQYIFERLFLVDPSKISCEHPDLSNSHYDLCHEIRRYAARALNVICTSCAEIASPFAQKILAQVKTHKCLRSNMLTATEVAVLDRATVSAVAALQNYQMQCTFTTSLMEPLVNELLGLPISRDKGAFMNYLFGSYADGFDTLKQETLSSQRRYFIRTLEQIGSLITLCGVPSDVDAVVRGGFLFHAQTGKVAFPGDSSAFSDVGGPWRIGHPLAKFVEVILPFMCDLTATFHRLYESVASENVFIQQVLQLSTLDCFTISGSSLTRDGGSAKELDDIVDSMFPISSDCNTQCVKLIRTQMGPLRHALYSLLAICLTVADPQCLLQVVSNFLPRALWDSIHFIPLYHIELQIRIVWKVLMSAEVVPLSENESVVNMMVSNILQKSLGPLAFRLTSEWEAIRIERQCIASGGYKDLTSSKSHLPSNGICENGGSGEAAMQRYYMQVSTVSRLSNVAINFVESLISSKHSDTFKTIQTATRDTTSGTTHPQNKSFQPLPAESPEEPHVSSINVSTSPKWHISTRHLLLKRILYWGSDLFVPLIKFSLASLSWPDVKNVKSGFHAIKRFVILSTKNYKPIPEGRSEAFTELLGQILRAFFEIPVWDPYDTSPTPANKMNSHILPSLQPESNNNNYSTPFSKFLKGRAGTEFSFIDEVSSVCYELLNAQKRIIEEAVEVTELNIDETLIRFPHALKSFYKFKELPLPLKDDELTELKCQVFTSNSKCARQIITKGLQRNASF